MEIQLYNQIQNPVEAVEKFGVMIAKSGMFGCDNENAGKVLAMICLSERKSPTELLRVYDIVKGKLRKKAMAAFAEFRAKGGKVKWVNTGDDGKEACADFTFEGQTIQVAFNISQAQAQGLVKADSAWTKTPGNMLRARVISNGLGMLCPEIFAGGDEDSEAVAAPAPEIRLTTPVAPIAAPETSVAVESEVVNEPQKNSVQAEPVAATNAATLRTPVQPVAAGLLPDETVAALEKAIGEHGVTAVNWMMKQTWLQPGQGLQHLTEARAKKILSNIDGFLRAITPSKKAGVQ